jgi:hypothetical protein
VSRQQRRRLDRQISKAARRNRYRHTKFYQEYVEHPPSVPIDAPPEPGRVYYVTFHHDAWCCFYETNDMADCNCDVVITQHVEPVRS